MMLRLGSSSNRCCAQSASQGPMPSSARSVFPQARSKHRALVEFMILSYCRVSQDSILRPGILRWKFPHSLSGKPTISFMHERLADHPIHNLALSGEKRKNQRHLSVRVSRAAKARIEGAHDGFNTVEHALSEFTVLDVVLRGLRHAFIHGVVVLSGRDHQVGPRHLSVFVHFVMMVQRAARRFGLA